MMNRILLGNNNINLLRKKNKTITMNAFTQEMEDIIKTYDGNPQSVNNEIDRRRDMKKGCEYNNSSNQLMEDINDGDEEILHERGFYECSTTHPEFTITAEFEDTPNNFTENENSRNYTQIFTPIFLDNFAHQNPKDRTAHYLVSATVIAVRNDFNYPVFLHTTGLYANNPSIGKSGNYGDIRIDPTIGEMKTDYALSQMQKSEVDAIDAMTGIPHVDTVRKGEVLNCTASNYSEKTTPSVIAANKNTYAGRSMTRKLQNMGSDSHGMDTEHALWVSHEFFQKGIETTSKQIQLNMEVKRLLDFTNIAFGISKIDKSTSFNTTERCGTRASELSSDGVIDDFFINTSFSDGDTLRTVYAKIKISTIVKAFQDTDLEENLKLKSTRW